MSSSTRVVLLSFGLSLMLATVAHPQNDNAVEPPTPDQLRQARLQQMMKAAAQSQRQQFQLQMDLQLDYMKRVCSLSDEQLRKLQVASKGAVEHSVARSMKQWNRFQQAFGGAFGGIRVFGGNANAAGGAIRLRPNPVPPGPPLPKPENVAPAEPKPKKREPVQPAKPRPAAKPNAVQQRAIQLQNDVAALAGAIAIEVAVPPDANNINMNAMAPGLAFNGQNQIAVTEELIWKKSVQRILTEEQHQTLLAAGHRQRKLRRDAGVRSYVARLDQQLLLSDDQREPLTTAVDQTIGWQFERQNPPGFGQQQQWILPVAGNQTPELTRRLQSILSETQFKQWQAQARGAGGLFWQVNPQWMPAPAMPGLNFENIDLANAPDPNRPMLGINLSGKGDGSVHIIKVLPNSPAAKAGLQTDDQILEFDNELVDKVADVTTRTRRHKPGDEVTLRIKRGAKELTIKAKLVSFADLNG